MGSKRRKGGRNTGAMSVVFIVIVFVVVMSIQILKLKEKDKLLLEREQTLQEQLAQEEQRAEELKDLDLYTRSMEYIKEMANKMGLVFENEIIFKESGE
ncbi:MAG: septum formation initiator family protein [Agathobacter sp.]|nr:septum formation initiator family protein [Agathobacter sp.]